MQKITDNIYILKPGELVRDDKKIIRYASSSVILMIDEFPLIVDTGLSLDWKTILGALKEVGFSKDDILMVINTHLHADHIGCNKKFRAKKYAHPLEIKQLSNNTDILPCPSKVSENISIIETPGHSNGHISVVFRDEAVIVCSGDAIPTKNNYIERVPPRIHVNKKLAMESFFKIEKVAEIIIPGHDEWFYLDSTA